jgi:hypothetical protein
VKPFDAGTAAGVISPKARLLPGLFHGFPEDLMLKRPRIQRLMAIRRYLY